MELLITVNQRALAVEGGMVAFDRLVARVDHTEFLIRSVRCRLEGPTAQAQVLKSIDVVMGKAADAESSGDNKGSGATCGNIGVESSDGNTGSGPKLCFLWLAWWCFGRKCCIAL